MLHTCIQQESLTNPPLIPAEPGTIQEMESLNQLRPINIDTTNSILTMKIRQNWSVSPSWRDFIFIDRSPFNSPVNMVVCYQILQGLFKWPLHKVEGRCTAISKYRYKLFLAWFSSVTLRPTRTEALCSVLQRPRQVLSSSRFYRLSTSFLSMLI